MELHGPEAVARAIAPWIAARVPPQVEILNLALGPPVIPTSFTVFSADPGRQIPPPQWPFLAVLVRSLVETKATDHTYGIDHTYREWESVYDVRVCGGIRADTYDLVEIGKLRIATAIRRAILTDPTINPSAEWLVGRGANGLREDYSDNTEDQKEARFYGETATTVRVRVTEQLIEPEHGPAHTLVVHPALLG